MKLQIRSGLPRQGRALSTQRALGDGNRARKPSAEAPRRRSGWSLRRTPEPPTPCAQSTQCGRSPLSHPRALRGGVSARPRGSGPGRCPTAARGSGGARSPNPPGQAAGLPAETVQLAAGPPGLGCGGGAGQGHVWERESARPLGATQPLPPARLRTLLPLGS